jgi:hypothetical protein
MPEVKYHLIGLEGNRVLSYEETKYQIEAVRDLECGLQVEGEPLSWDAFDDPTEQRTLFQKILEDRYMRVNKRTLMSERPSFCAITSIDGRAVRLEFYEGKRTLKLVFDIRAKEYEEEKWPNFLDRDPQSTGALVHFLEPA